MYNAPMPRHTPLAGTRPESDALARLMVQANASPPPSQDATDTPVPTVEQAVRSLGLPDEQARAARRLIEAIAGGRSADLSTAARAARTAGLDARLVPELLRRGLELRYRGGEARPAAQVRDAHGYARANIDPRARYAGPFLTERPGRALVKAQGAQGAPKEPPEPKEPPAAEPGGRFGALEVEAALVDHKIQAHVRQMEARRAALEAKAGESTSPYERATLRRLAEVLNEVAGGLRYAGVNGTDASGLEPGDITTPMHKSLAADEEPEVWLGDLQVRLPLHGGDGRLAKAVIRTPRKPDGSVDYEAVPVGASIWVRVTNEASPLHGRPILITKRPDHTFALTGGAAYEHIQARRHLVMQGGGAARAARADDELRRKKEAAEAANAPKRAQIKELQRQAREQQQAAEAAYMRALGIEKRGLTAEERRAVYETVRNHALAQGFTEGEAAEYARLVSAGLARKDRQQRLKQVAHRVEAARYIAQGATPEEAHERAGAAPSAVAYRAPDVSPEEWRALSAQEREHLVNADLDRQEQSHDHERRHDEQFGPDEPAPEEPAATAEEPKTEESAPEFVVGHHEQEPPPLVDPDSAREALEHLREYARARKAEREGARTLERVEGEAAAPASLEQLKLQARALTDEELEHWLSDYTRKATAPADDAFYNALSPHWNDEIGDQLSGHVIRGASTAMTALVGEDVAARFDVQRVTEVLGPEAAAAALVHRLREEMTPEEFEQWVAKLRTHNARNQQEQERVALQRHRELQEQEAVLRRNIEGGDLQSQAMSDALVARNLEEQRENLGTALGSLQASAALYHFADMARQGRGRNMPVTINVSDELALRDKEKRLRGLKYTKQYNVATGAWQIHTDTASLRKFIGRVETDRKEADHWRTVKFDHSGIEPDAEGREWVPSYKVPGFRESFPSAEELPTDLKALAGQPVRLMAHQRNNIEWIYGSGGGLVTERTGGGKTVISLGVAAKMLHDNPAGLHLRIVPDGREDQWATEVRTFTHMNAVVLPRNSTKEERARLLREAPPGSIVIVGHRNAGRYDYEALAERSWDSIGVDEPQELRTKSGRLGQGAKRIFAIPARNRHALTATPATDSPVEAYDIVNWTRPGKLGARTKFKRAFEGFGGGTNAQDAAVAKLIWRELEPHVSAERGVPPHYRVTHREVKVQVSPSQRMAQREIESRVATAVEEAVNAAYEKKRQGVRGYADRSFAALRRDATAAALAKMEAEHRANLAGGDIAHNPKLKALRETLRSSHPNERHVVFVEGDEQRRALVALLEREGRKVFNITASARNATRKVDGKEVAAIEVRKREWKATPGGVIVIDKTSASGHNLAEGDHLHILGNPSDAAEMLQAHGRLGRANRRGDFAIHTYRYADSPFESAHWNRLHRQLKILRATAPGMFVEGKPREAAGEEPAAAVAAKSLVPAITLRKAKAEGGRLALLPAKNNPRVRRWQHVGGEVATEQAAAPAPEPEKRQRRTHPRFRADERDWRKEFPKLSRYPTKTVKHVQVSSGGTNWVLRWKHPKTGETVNAYPEAYVQEQHRKKFAAMRAFGGALPAFREAVEQGLKKKPSDPEAVLAAMGRVLDKLFIRAGNTKSAKKGDAATFGLTTLEKRHVRVDGNRVTFEFVGKAGVPHVKHLDDPAVARVVRHLLKLPGDRLFQVQDARGQVHPVGGRLRKYIKEHMGPDAHVKDFRTYHASRIFAEKAALQGVPKNKKEAEQRVQQAALHVAVALGHKRMVKRKHFVRVHGAHPEHIGPLADAHGGKHVGDGVVGFHRVADVKAYVRALGGAEHEVLPKDRHPESEPEWVHETATSLKNYIDPHLVEAYKRGALRDHFYKAAGLTERLTESEKRFHRLLDALMREGLPDLPLHRLRHPEDEDDEDDEDEDDDGGGPGGGGGEGLRKAAAPAAAGDDAGWERAPLSKHGAERKRGKNGGWIYRYPHTAAGHEALAHHESEQAKYERAVAAAEERRRGGKLTPQQEKLLESYKRLAIGHREAAMHTRAYLHREGFPVEGELPATHPVKGAAGARRTLAEKVLTPAKDEKEPKPEPKPHTAPEPVGQPEPGTEAHAAAVESRAAAGRSAAAPQGAQTEAPAEPPPPPPEGLDHLPKPVAQSVKKLRELAARPTVEPKELARHVDALMNHLNRAAKSGRLSPPARQSYRRASDLGRQMAAAPSRDLLEQFLSAVSHFFATVGGMAVGAAVGGIVAGPGGALLGAATGGKLAGAGAAAALRVARPGVPVTRPAPPQGPEDEEKPADRKGTEKPAAREEKKPARDREGAKRPAPRKEDDDEAPWNRRKEIGKAIPALRLRGGQVLDAPFDAAADLRKGKARPPGTGWEPIPHGVHGGMRRRHGDRWEYWYRSKTAAHQAARYHAKLASIHEQAQAEGEAQGDPRRAEHHAERAQQHREAASGAHAFLLTRQPSVMPEGFFRLHAALPQDGETRAKVEAIHRALARVPHRILDGLHARGYRFHVAPTVTDVMTRLRNEPRIYGVPEGTLWDTATGVADSIMRWGVVATEHNTLEKAPATAVHELCHLLDYLGLNGPSEERLCEAEWFQEWYNAAADRSGGRSQLDELFWKVDGRERHDYLHVEPIGAIEAWAEVGRAIFTGHARKVEALWPGFAERYRVAIDEALAATEEG